MCHPPALVGCCEGKLHLARHMATVQSGLPPASGRAHGAVASVRFTRGLGWLVWQCHYGSGHLPQRGWVVALLCGMLVGRHCHGSVHCCNGSVRFWLRVLLRNARRKAWQQVFCWIHRQAGGGQNGGSWNGQQRWWHICSASWWVCFLIVQKIPLPFMSFGRPSKKSHFRLCHLVDQDALSRFGCDKDLVVGLGFLASPRKLRHCTKQAASTLGRQHLGELLQNLAIECKLFEPWKGKMTRAVMPLHELRLLIGGR